ncbi:unnamed protein product [Arabidopsis thaliana]|uniref:Uncharacterized protein n=1 Tax=Arabidopsis thaliana TaxID=3702 RepID=Q9LSF9_ARATH|nr:unnamed protein product [Arabidopsis thaliana]
MAQAPSSTAILRCILLEENRWFWEMLWRLESGMSSEICRMSV